MSGETKLTIAEEDRPKAFLELTDEALGRFARSYLIQIGRQVDTHAGNREMPLPIAMSMHGSIALYRMAFEANAGELHLTHSEVEWGGENRGDWEMILRRVDQGEVGPA